MSASEEQSQGPVIRDRRRIDPVTGQPRNPAQSAGSADAGSGQAGSAQEGQAHRGTGQPRPGKHAVSKPGSTRQEAAGAAQAGTSAATDGAQPGAAQPQQPGPGGGQSQAGDSDLAVKLAERTADLQRVQAEYANYRKRVERDRTAVREHALASVVAELLPVLDDIGRAREHDELTGGFKAVAEALESAAAKLGLTTFGESGEPFDPNVHEALMHSYSPDVTEPTCVQILQPGYKVGERILRPARVAVAEPTDPAGARTSAASDAAGSGEDAEQGSSKDREGSPETDDQAPDETD